MKNINVRMTAAAAALMVAAGPLAVPAFAVQREGVCAHASDRASSARARRELEGQSMNSVFLLPDSDTYYISESDISWMNDNELMLARNEFYARRGRKFATKSIQDYFNRQGWYYGTINPDDFTPEMFNRYEQANVDFIVAYEKKRKEIRAQKQKEPAAHNELSVVYPASADTEAQYSEIVDVYRDSMRENWSEEEYSVAGMNRMAAGLDLPGDLGYIYMDLNGDGKQELLIGPTNPQLYGEGAVFEIYTIDDGIPVEIASSDENDLYYICEGNTVRREVFLDEGHWEIDYYDLEGEGLVCKDMLVMDESRDKEDPWFVIDDTEGFASVSGVGISGQAGELEDEYESISYEDASNLRANYVAEALEYIPFEN